MPRFSDLLKPELAKDPADLEFHSVRGRAIGAYGRLEQELCGVYFRLTGGTDVPATLAPEWQKSKATAAKKFFKMSSKERLDKSESLLQAKCGNTYSLFWNSLRKHLAATIERRNEVVHWQYVKAIDDNGAHHRLVPPNFWDLPSLPSISTDDLWDFFDKCHSLAGYCRCFGMLLDDGIREQIEAHSPETITAFRRVCQQEAVYPVPDDHYAPTPPTTTPATSS